MSPQPTKTPKPPPKAVADFTVLPLTLSPLPGLPDQCSTAFHYMYIKPHTPSIPTPSSDRSLFIANLPIDASESSLRTLFSEHLGGSMVERVEFDASVPAEPMHKRWKSEGTGAVTMQGKKRKRGDDKEIVAEGVVEDAESALPPLWSNGIRTSGSAGVVVFVDGKSARGAMRGVLRVVKEEGEVVWRGEEGGMGVERYKSHNNLMYPPPSLLQSSLNAYLSQFNALETMRNRLRKTARSIPDEDGFVAVVRGGRVGPARLEEAEKKKAELDERKRNHRATDDFYRFQNRERRKKAEGELKRRFEEDRKRVEGMRERRGKVRPEA
ncbi:hypothetical protein GGP41_008503 [Bipolaris sorokiniana]|uniref:RRM domain-containing protein n=2 Tax=Cochliobolus sativus TaxID=45130 RepID=A0A8H5Z977_COCSA|nr:uncharacterized protein COCSADRAFT_30499 [Bipolaris sorokiniana ND90Pr]EMD59727.1 hypothetical protein COCSADRAFT_30499 [Bipolaris sorokiniana ND90Pr]KAF5845993.1 hypothetical protein GGP41_008503 [Bipolaris sorokiniana]